MENKRLIRWHRRNEAYCRADPRLLMNFSQMLVGKLITWEQHNVLGTGGSRY
jgi:hypothetical protein